MEPLKSEMWQYILRGLCTVLARTHPRMREAMVIVYFADGARLAEDAPLKPGAPPQEFYARMIRQQNRTTSLPGLRPGDRAEGPMTPLVYSRSRDAE